MLIPVCIACVLGFSVGYLLAWAHGRTELARYKEGMADAKALDPNGGVCWVRGQLPRHDD